MQANFFYDGQTDCLSLTAVRVDPVTGKRYAKTFADEIEVNEGDVLPVLRVPSDRFVCHYASSKGIKGLNDLAAQVGGK